jgi:hypothetical protein
MAQVVHAYEVRPRKDHRGVDLISDALPFGRLWYGEPDAVGNAIGYAKFSVRSHNAVISVSPDDYDHNASNHCHVGASAFNGKTHTRSLSGQPAMDAGSY